MTWGDSWGHSPGRNALMLAEAYAANRDRDLGGGTYVRAQSYSTVYYYRHHPIAERLTDEYFVQQLARHLADGVSAQPKEVFTIGLGDKASLRHLRALGIECARQSNDVVTMFGKEVKHGERVSREQLAERPDWQPPPRPPKRPRFVNNTMELFT